MENLEAEVKWYRIGIALLFFILIFILFAILKSR
jgi:hypothetical protein